VTKARNRKAAELKENTTHFPAEARILCALDTIPDPGSRGFATDGSQAPSGVFLVRRNGRVYGYRNQCPHTGGPLDWLPHAFLDHEHTYIVCATHGARFRVEDGICVDGPCAGDRLTPIQLSFNGGIVAWEED